MDKSEIKKIIHEILSKLYGTTEGISVEENNGVGGVEHWFSVELKDPHHFLQHEGEAIFSLNHLVKRILESKLGPENNGNENRTNILIDVNGFQKKRIDNLHTLAHMMAERARYFKSSIEIDPMSAFERRIVHEFLSGEIDLKTESEGYGKDRRVVIKYIGEI